MGEAKRRLAAAQAAGLASAEPVELSRHAMYRIRGLMERAQQAADLAQLLSQQARAAQTAYEQGVLQALQDKDVELPAGEGRFVWEFHWAQSTIGWRFEPAAAPEPAVPAVPPDPAAAALAPES